MAVALDDLVNEEDELGSWVDEYQEEVVHPQVRERMLRIKDGEFRARQWAESLRSTWSETEDWTIDWSTLSGADRRKLKKMLEGWRDALFLPRVPNPKQLVLLTAPERGMSEPILFGGGMGGGKSSGLVMAAIKACRAIPNNRVLLARFTFAALRISTLLELEEQLVECPDAIHQKGHHRVWFPETNSYLYYFGLGRPSERQRIRSTMWGWIGVDEVTEIAEEIANEIAMRLRWGPAAVLKELQMCYTCNPEPGWVKEQFVSNPRPGYRFIKSLPLDNPWLNGGDYAGYIEDARRRQPKEWFDAYILGDWDAFVPADAAIPETLMRGMRDRLEDPDDEDCVWGVDVARSGNDWTTVWRRRGTVFDLIGRWRHVRTTVTTDRLCSIYRHSWPKPWRINIDDGGVGGGVSDQLVRQAAHGKLGMTAIGQVVAQSTPDNDDQAARNYYNKRAELFGVFRRMLEAGIGSFSEPTGDQDMLRVIGDLTTPRAFQASRRNRVVYAVEQKDQVKLRLGRSPDDGDGILLTLHEGRRDFVPGSGPNFVGSESEEEVQANFSAYHRLRRLELAERITRAQAGYAV